MEKNAKSTEMKRNTKFAEKEVEGEFNSAGIYTWAFFFYVGFFFFFCIDIPSLHEFAYS